MNAPSEHQDGKGEKMQPRQSLREPLIVFDNPSKASRPGKAALHDPSPRQQHKTTLGF